MTSTAATRTTMPLPGRAGALVPARTRRPLVARAHLTQ
ncbi:hypothetical protein STXM2123_1814 [Streptomyces sp. F-3]|nr:hypothetical protein STXM2123_1814 [Streptomyces sp. F-3]